MNIRIVKKPIADTLRAVLPKRIRQALIHLGYRLEPLEFARFAHVYCIAPSMSAALSLISSRGFRPGTIIDVGAYEGDWIRQARRVWPSAKRILVEANRNKLNKLEALGEVHCALLGAEDGKIVEFNVMETGSSVLAENSSAPRHVETRTIATLDALHLEVASPGFLKIDAQGYELEILKGCTRTLSVIDAILLEVALIEINKGAPLLHEVIKFMDQIGFIACEVFELHRRPLDRALSQMDIFFVRKKSSLLADTRYSN